MARQPGGIRRRQVLRQRRHRPAVGGDVVHHQHQDTLVRPQHKQPRPHRHLRSKIEARTGLRTQRLSEPSLVHLGYSKGEFGLLRTQNKLVGLAVVRLAEHGAQALVPARHIPQRCPQSIDVHTAPQTQRHGNVVCRRRALELAEEPQPALRERHRHTLRTLHAPPAAPAHRHRRGPAASPARPRSASRTAPGSPPRHRERSGYG